MNPSKEETTYGLLAEFSSLESFLDAVKSATQEGYKKVDTFTPFPIHELSHLLGIKKTALPLLVLIGGMFGAFGGFFLQYYISVINYPYNVGGRPYNSWPAFIPVTFELGILCAAFAAVLGMLALNGLPMPYHPVFNVERFALARHDRFFLCIESKDPKFDLEKTKSFLETLNPDWVTDVEP